jgi:hypothetical protein
VAAAVRQDFYSPNRSERFGRRMLGKVKRGLGWRLMRETWPGDPTWGPEWTWGTGRPPVGPVKNGVLGLEKPGGLSGALGGVV